jgi:hypothetical protein
LDPTVSTGLVLAEGYGALETPTGLSQTYVNVGPQLYFPHGSVTVRFIPLWTQGQAGASSIEGSLQLGDEGKTLTTLTLQNGIVPAYAPTNPLISDTVQDRVFAADLSVKHWIQPRLGFELGVNLSHATDRFSGANVYNSTGATVGVFVGVGHSTTLP